MLDATLKMKILSLFLAFVVFRQLQKQLFYFFYYFFSTFPFFGFLYTRAHVFGCLIRCKAEAGLKWISEPHDMSSVSMCEYFASFPHVRYYAHILKSMKVLLCLQRKNAHFFSVFWVSRKVGENILTFFCVYPKRKIYFFLLSLSSQFSRVCKMFFVQSLIHG